MSLPGRPLDISLAPGYSIRQLENDWLMLLFGAEEVVALCHPSVSVSTVGTAVLAHQAYRLEHASQLEVLMGPDSRMYRPGMVGDWLL